MLGRSALRRFSKLSTLIMLWSKQLMLSLNLFPRSSPLRFALIFRPALRDCWKFQRNMCESTNWLASSDAKTRPAIFETSQAYGRIPFLRSASTLFSHHRRQDPHHRPPDLVCPVFFVRWALCVLLQVSSDSGEDFNVQWSGVTASTMAVSLSSETCILVL